MDFEIIIKPIAQQDLEEAISWYENKLSGSGRRFYYTFLSALNKINKSSTSYMEVLPPVRRCIIKNFPYKIFYTIEDDKIFIIGIVHSKGSPEFVAKHLNED
jgi:hypothetical protein